MLSVNEYAPKISDVKSSRKNSRFLLEQYETQIRSSSFNGSRISTHNDSKMFVLNEFKSLLILYLKVIGIHIPTPPPLDNFVKFDLL